MKKIIERARSFRFHSLQYVVPEESIAIIEKDDFILIGEKDGHKIKIHWGCSSLKDLLDGLRNLSDMFTGKEITLQFIPPDFIEDLENEGFKVQCEFVDFWIKDLGECTWDESHSIHVRPLKKEEAGIASSITKSCKDLSRGFYGEDKDFILDWLSHEENEVFAAVQDHNILGICMMSTYDNPKGTVAWLRELAVHPNSQNRGIGTTLSIEGLRWAKGKGATLSFLATDIENTNAISLYKKLGYVQAEGPGEIIISKVI